MYGARQHDLYPVRRRRLGDMRGNLLLAGEMTILLPILAVAFTAFCVWLAVRIMNRRERWAKRTLTLVVGLPVLYLVSFGSAIYLHYTYTPREEFFYRAYAPVFSLVDNPDAPLTGHGPLMSSGPTSNSGARMTRDIAGARRLVSAHPALNPVEREGALREVAPLPWLPPVNGRARPNVISAH